MVDLVSVHAVRRTFIAVHVLAKYIHVRVWRARYWLGAWAVHVRSIMRIGHGQRLTNTTAYSYSSANIAEARGPQPWLFVTFRCIEPARAIQCHYDWLMNEGVSDI